MKTFPVKKGDVIELGEGSSSTALRDGTAYFTEDGVAMLKDSEMTDFDAIHDLIAAYWDIAYKEGKTGVSHGTEAQEVLSKINLAVAHEARDLALVQNLLNEYGLQALDVVEAFKAAKDVEPVHTDHPMRHYDRTCPACQEGMEPQPPNHPTHDDTALLRQCLMDLDELIEAGAEAWGSQRPCVKQGSITITALRERLFK